MRLYHCYSDFFAELNGTEVILTPNQRLSRFVQQQFDCYQIAQNNTAWSSLACSSWSLWFTQLAPVASSGRWVMNDALTQSLWQQVAAESEAIDYMPDFDHTLGK